MRAIITHLLAALVLLGRLEADRQELKYQSPTCSYRYQELFRVPFENFKIFQEQFDTVGENSNFQFLGDFSIKHDGIVQCSAAQSRYSHYELNVVDLDSYRSMKVTVDVIGNEEASFEKQLYSTGITSCDKDKVVEGLDDIKINLPRNTSLQNYRTLPKTSPFYATMEGKNVLSVKSTGGCDLEEGYLLKLEADLQHGKELETISTDVWIYGGNSEQQQRIRRSAETQSLIETEVNEGSTMVPVDVLRRLGISGQDVSYEITRQNDKIQLLIATGFVEQRPGQVLDRETATEHTLEFVVREIETNQVYRVEFRLIVLDIDDSAPMVTNEQDPLQGFVPREPEPGLQILELFITDPDSIPEDFAERRWTITLSSNSLFQLSRSVIEPSGAEESVWIEVEDTNGIVFQEDQYILTLTLADRVGNSRIEEVTIIIGEPQLQVLPIPAVIEVPEDQEPGYLVYEVRVERGATAGLTFEYSDNILDDFTTNKFFGDIRTKKRFDLDVEGSVQTEYNDIQVTVRDNSGQEVTRSFSIKIIDQNDQPPVFDPKVYIAVIDEDYPENLPILFNDGKDDAVHATDADLTSPNNRVYYILNSDVPFIVNQENGKIFPHGLDYETTQNGQLDSFTVLAKDEGIDSTNEDSATVIITLRNVNDESPIFDMQTDAGCVYEFTVDQAIPENFVVGSVSAYDPDGNSITYQISGTSNPPFEFRNPVSGVISRKANVEVSGGQPVLQQEVYLFDVVANEDASPSSGASNSATCMVRVQVESANQNAPVFENCPTDPLEIPENSPFGFSFYTLRARDDDFGQSGRIDYTVQSDEWFGIRRRVESVNPEVAVGDLRVNSASLDRETKSEHCVYVLARDGFSETETSNIYQQSACKVCVTLLDVKDTPPIFFTSGPLEVEIEDTRTGTILTIVAYDLDEEDVIRYDIVTDESDNSELFSIGSSDGVLSVTGSLSSILQGEEEVVNVLTVRATDLEPSSTNKKVNVVITRNPTGGTPPVFEELLYVYQVDEDFMAGSFLQPAIKVTLGSTTGRCLFSLGGGDTPTTNGENTFDYGNVNAAGNEVSIKLRRALDYESVRRYEFRIICIDSTSQFLVGDARVVVDVQDVNDIIPLFTGVNNVFSVYEGVPFGTVVGNVEATDEDTATVLSYTLTAFTDYNSDWFQIDTGNGFITVASSTISRANGATWIGTATVSDGNPSALRTSGQPNEAERQVIINIWDVNDNAPVIVPEAGTNGVYNVPETASVGYIIDSFRAEDIDTDPEQKFTFSITLDSGYAPFSINNQGVLRVSDQLDADEQVVPNNQYKFNIQVFDNAQNSDPFEVTINVINADDEPPVFSGAQSFSVLEEDTSIIGRVVFTVVAVNEDAVPGTDAGIVYGLSGGGVGDAFDINSQTGEITLLRKLDREAPGESSFLLLASATEIASGLTNVEELDVEVVDINDHAPYFDELSLRGRVKENTPVGDTFMEIFARDEDLKGPPLNYGDIVLYSMTASGTCGDLFSVRADGAIVVENQIDREALNFPFDECTIEINAEDGGGLFASTVITIVIEDVDDIDPQFATDPVAANIDERDESNTLVYGIYVIDGDTSAENAQSNEAVLVTTNTAFPDSANFAVAYNPTRNMVEITNSGPLTFASLNKNPGDTLKIQINLLKNGVTVDTASCTFTLIDWNTHEPIVVVLTPANLPIQLDEGPGFDPSLPVATLSVSDLDEDQDGVTNNYEWYILWSSDPSIRFRVEGVGKSATVYQIEALDYEITTEQQPDLIVCARDIPLETYKPSLSGCVEIGLEVRNLDDTCPIFEPLPVLTVPENVDSLFQISLSFNTLDFDDENGLATDATISVVTMDSTLFSFTNGVLAKNAGTRLDREVREFYELVFNLCDQIGNCCEQTVYVRVEDRNDEPQFDGGMSLVRVFFLQDIGETAEQIDLDSPVYVNDADCCTSNDKTFTMTSGDTEQFAVDDNGELSIFGGLTTGSYIIQMTAEDDTNSAVNRIVTAEFNIEVNAINQDMLDHMMTLKLIGITANQFVGAATWNSRTNYYRRLRELIRDQMGLENLNQVVIFALKESEDEFETDYGWPYHRPELDVGLVIRTEPEGPFYFSPVYVNAELSLHRVSLSNSLGVDIAEVNVDLCERGSISDDGCFTSRTVNPGGQVVVGSSSPFSLAALELVIVRVTNRLYYKAIAPQRLFGLAEEVCIMNPCKNGGECFAEYGDLSTQTMRYTYRCECVRGYTGPNCEKMQRTFTGQLNMPSYALFEPIIFYSRNQHLTFKFKTDQPDGLLLYAGPMDALYHITSLEATNQHQDFVALEIRNGQLRLHANSGCGTLTLTLGNNLNDGEIHSVDLFIGLNNIDHYTTLRLDKCVDAIVDEGEFYTYITRESVCQVSNFIPGCGNFITAPEPLQLGGAVNAFLSYQDIQSNYFNGVISDFINNGYVYDLAEPVMELRTVGGDTKTERFCFVGETAYCAGNSRCVASYNNFIYCDCEIGRYGDRCQYETEPHYFNEDSFIQYNVDASSAVVTSQFTDTTELDMQVSFKTTVDNVRLMVVRNQLGYKFIRLELFGGVPRVTISLGYQLQTVSLSSNGRTPAETGIWAADGNEHTLRFLRVNNYFLLTLDGGGAYRQVFLQGTAFSLFELYPLSVSVGGWPTYNSLDGLYDVVNGFRGCINDARLNTLSLPIQQNGGYPDSPDIVVLVSQNIEPGCDKDPCAARTEPCPPPRTTCLNWFDISFCTCPPGTSFDFINDVCVNINECDGDGVCVNGGICTDYDPLDASNTDGYLFLCTCPENYRGVTCAEAAAIVSSASLSLAAFLIIVLAFLFLFPLLILFIWCVWKQSQNKAKPVKDVYSDDQRLGFGQFEGGGERDQEDYNVLPLRKPKSDVLYTSEGPVMMESAQNQNLVNMAFPANGFAYHNQGFVSDESIPPPSLNHQNMLMSAGNAPLDAILGSRVESADNALRIRGADCMMVYHYEGEGSDAGTLSSVNTAPQAPPDWDQFIQWQRDNQLGLLAHMFTDGTQDAD